MSRRPNPRSPPPFRTERQRDAALAQQLAASAAAPLEQKADTEALVGSMNQLMAGMRQYQYELYRSPEVGAGVGGRVDARHC